MRSRLIKTGQFLFQYRSFTPLPMILLIAVCMQPGPGLSMAALGLLIAVVGQAIRTIAVGYSFAGTSGRESYLRADRLNTTGIYSLIRNPLYVGNILIFSGLMIAYDHWAAFLTMFAFMICQYACVIAAEEDYLARQYGENYLAYQRRVPAMIPRTLRLQKTDHPFNWHKVLFKENDSIFNLLAAFLAILVYKRWARFHLAPARWQILVFCLFLLLYIFIKVLKHLQKKREHSSA